ncbi:prenyltransferase [Halobacillus mangrovi]|uniref:1,4-dihydroxy-2-naphthoate prenyltransferase n=1 Tax=Halobacillus mangrovi TaxID=402384 RepID=A0A1W5ZSS0_9BACI|nr:prenyltransferase [Halobacillus mangrovi]ARI76344.1 1,4-dihydroxy-2-naphthoate prenyltransferase [Halobacillus mangrovi]
MFSHALSTIKGGWQLLRFIAVVSSSVATIVSTILPLYLYSDVSFTQLSYIFFLLLSGALLIHGVLTHILNDYIDDKSGTDTHSPAILSGGSRVIQTGTISSETMWKLGKGLILILSLVVIGLLIAQSFKLAILLSLGLWGAISYSLPPLLLSYRPFLGEWLSTFPSVLFLGLAGAWLALDTLPQWAWQNAIINALICIAWVMVHHIPDMEADRQATPKKLTCVVWAADTFGKAYCRLPALLYFGLTGLCVTWLGIDRIVAAGGVFATVIISMALILKMDVDDHEQVSNYEKLILMLAMGTAVWLGLFI